MVKQSTIPRDLLVDKSRGGTPKTVVCIYSEHGRFLKQ